MRLECTERPWPFRVAPSHTSPHAPLHSSITAVKHPTSHFFERSTALTNEALLVNLAFITASACYTKVSIEL